MPQIRKILVPTDFSSGSRAALDFAVLLAHKFDATVDLIHAWQIPVFTDGMTGFAIDFAGTVQKSANENLEAWKASLQKEIPNGKAFLVMADPATAVVDHAANGYDLIVAGTHGRTGLTRWALGSVAERIVRHAPCAVLTVREAKKSEGAAKGG